MVRRISIFAKVELPLDAGLPREIFGEVGRFEFVSDAFVVGGDIPHT